VKTILSHANLIDCVEPKVRPDAAVLIEDGRILAIMPSGEAESVSEAQMIDLKGGYLMPGLWDVHIHPDYLSLDEVPLADQVTLFGHRLAAALTESGIVGLRCAGAHHFMDVAWKRAFDSGQHLGPRLFASGYFLTTTGGHFLTSGHALEVDGPYGWVKAIREQIKNGVDHIKLNLSGGINGAGMGPPHPFVPARRRDPRCLRDLPEARLQGHGACHQPGCGEECDPAGRS
jgi:imidazolonepropionase-like amidohydrolase